ncbi:ABC transporter ATP-binding protein [Streptomyces sp. NBC_01716]|uniref:ABC transporter ATP-binding protein n=1 Tax=Streptomyces sp. NBC_01716 TaxID=2975917 RepID=UPI002E30B3BD|nr:ABC transporter ATP-binding protein [Streptomyces sp. NBC_01716]
MQRTPLARAFGRSGSEAAAGPFAAAAPTGHYGHSEPGADHAIELERLTKFYPGRKDEENRPVPAVDSIDLRVPRGQVFGLLGRNGAGKSTTVRMIATLLEPSSGSIRVYGLDAGRHRRAVRAQLGVALGGERSVYWKLTARQNLEYFAALHGVPRRRSRARITELLEQVGLTDRADDYVEQYSTGMRQRLVIARAVLHRPGVLLLDEPASGLDPHSAEDLHSLIRRLRDDGHTILLTTHDMAEADLLSDRVGIIHAGRVRAVGTPVELKRSVGAARVLNVQVRHPGRATFYALRAELARRALVTVRNEASGSDGWTADLTLSSRDEEDLGPWLFEVTSRHRVTVSRLENEMVSLRDAFLALTTDDERKGGESVAGRAES